MTRQTTVVQVFVASPSDVVSERDALEAVIRELNRTWSTSLGVAFDLVRWETHVRPGVGKDPQAVVNDQIGESYDVFIGILWGRFGTPTPRALSGTEEEFERALQRLKRGDNVELMIYFKDAPISPSKVDPLQLQRVHDFRASLPERGCVFKFFEDESSFQSSLRADLAAVAQAFSKGGPGVRNNSDRQQVAAPITENDDEMGYLDYIETYQSRMAEMTAALGHISGATERIADQMQERTREVSEHSQQDLDVKTARRLVKKAADDMDAYAQILNKQLSVMSRAREASFYALSKAIALQEDFDSPDQPTQLATLRESLVRMAATSNESKAGFAKFRGTIHGMPRLTLDFNRARRAATTQLDAMSAEIDMVVQTAGNIVDAIDRFGNT